MIASLVVSIILGVLAVCIIVALAYRYLYIRKWRKRTRIPATQIFYVPPPTTTRSEESYYSSGSQTPVMSQIPFALTSHKSQNFASEIPAPIIPEAEPSTPLADMFSPYTTHTTPFYDLTNPIVQTAAIRTPKISEQPRVTISRSATELSLEISPVTTPLSGSRPFSPATVSSIQESINETPVVKTAVALNVIGGSIPRYSMVPIDNERPKSLSPPRTAYLPYRSEDDNFPFGTAYIPYKPPQS